MPLDEKTIEDVRGDLTDEQLELVDWDRIQVYVREAVLAQRPETRTELLRRGQDLYHLAPFKDGYTTVTHQGQKLLRLHVSRLYADTPLRLSQMKKVEK